VKGYRSLLLIALALPAVPIITSRATEAYGAFPTFDSEAYCTAIVRKTLGRTSFDKCNEDEKYYRDSMEQIWNELALEIRATCLINMNQLPVGSYTELDRCVGHLLIVDFKEGRLVRK
jgi:hypothetical protein